MSDIAILHDRFPGIGGGETFAMEAARVLDAPIYTMYVASGTDIPDDVDVITLRQSKYAAGLSKHVLEWHNKGMNPLETLSVALDMTDVDALTEYDVVLESGPLSNHYVPTTEQAVLNYPHSPPRWLYDLFRDRVDAVDYPLVGTVFRAYAKVWRTLDKETNDYVDEFVANSELIQERIRRYYARDASVVYPAVTGEWRNEGDEGYFVTWSRLDPEKRINLIAEAFTDLDERLVIAGDGEQRELLERIAADHDNIDVRGYVEDIESLVASASAVIYAPKQEDFGLVGAEALTAGKPLLGVNEGFTKYQVKPGVTGELFEPNMESIRETVRSFNSTAYKSDRIQKIAKRYSHENFKKGLCGVIRKHVADT
jgi:glycosyltransferase involved in cell wall biosynthesis